MIDAIRTHYLKEYEKQILAFNTRRFFLPRSLNLLDSKVLHQNQFQRKIV